MSLLARADVLAFVLADDELPGAIRWATHAGLEHRWCEDELTLSLRLRRAADESATAEDYLLSGCFDDYRAMPPEWRFLDPESGADIGVPAYPAPGAFPGGSVLHGNGVICAPWNRLAYGDRGGPHPQWTEPAKWQSIEPSHTHAATIPDMLARVRAEVLISPRRLSPLPDSGET